MPTVSEIRNRLPSLADPAYKTFVDKLQPGVANRLGVRMPELRKMAREIIKENPIGFLMSVFKDPSALETQEMRLLTAMVTGGADLATEVRLKFLTALLPYLDGWVTTDLAGGDMKVFRESAPVLTLYLKGLLAAERATDVRLGLVILLNHYKSRARIPEALSILASSSVWRLARRDYLVSMGLAWTAAAFFVVLPDVTQAWLTANLREGRLDVVTLSRTLQKIRDSRAVPADRKAALTARFSEVFARKTGNLA